MRMEDRTVDDVIRSARVEVRDLPGSQRAALYAGMLTFTLALAWCGVSVVSCFWLSAQLGLTDQDMKDMSWGVSYVLVEWATNMISKVIGLALGLMLLGLAVARQSKYAAMVGVAWMVFAWSLSVKLIAPVYVAAGAAKIGCFVEEKKECFEMLRVPQTGLRSMYVTRDEADSTGEVLAPWYRDRIGSMDLPVRFELPAYAFLSSPSYVFKVDEVKSMVQRKRARVAELRAMVPRGRLDQ